MDANFAARWDNLHEYKLFRGEAVRYAESWMKIENAAATKERALAAVGDVPNDE